MKLLKILKTTIIFPLFVIYLSNCATIEKTSFLVSKSDSIKIGYTQLKVLLYDFYDTFSSTTEQSANYIITNTNDKEVKKMALRWKINAIAEAGRSISLADPFAALIDSRAYCYQLKYFFSYGNGGSYFGEYQHVAVETTELLVERIDNISLQAISQKKFDNNQQEFLEWVSENPINGPEFSRRSTVSLFVEFIGDDTKDLSSSISSIEEALTDIRGRLSVYSISLPKQAQWQTELIIEESLQREEFDRTLNNLDTIAISLHEINKVIQRLDLLLENVVDDSFSEIDRQRLATLNELKSERQLIVELIQAERQIVLDAIALERHKTVKDAELLAKNMISSSSVLLYDIVDHIFIRIIQLTAIIAILIFATLLFMRRYRMSK
jgi:hypothetical protein